LVEKRCVTKWKIFGVLRVAAGGDKRPFVNAPCSSSPFLFRAQQTTQVNGDRSDSCIVPSRWVFLTLPGPVEPPVGLSD
jgi:hypothetical protein